MVTETAIELLSVRPAWGTASAWRESIFDSLTILAVASVGWVIHWSMSGRLQRAPDPMGRSHRGSLARTGYFLGVVLVSAIVVLPTAAWSLTTILLELFGLQRADAAGRLIEEAGGPLTIALVFLVAWWWHRRRASSEALAFGGQTRQRSVVRATRLIVAIVGLAGLAVSFVWGLAMVLDLMGTPSGRDLIPSSTLRVATPALAAALVGLIMWLPAWLRSQQERTRTGVEAATATARRTYLLFVSGVAVVAVMGSLAWLIYEAMRQLLDIGAINDTSWAISLLAVASVGLAYHLLELRSDLRLSRALTPEAAEPVVLEAPEASRAREAIEISGPVDADFTQLNDVIASSLPDGFALRVIPPPER
jgi:hypothetical protein